MKLNRERYTAIICMGMLGFCLLAGCGSPAPLAHSPDDIRDHVISVDGHGIPHDPSSPEGAALEMPQFRSQLAHLFGSMRRFQSTHPDRKILIFVHGGMNAPASSLTSADGEIDQVMAAGYYPIYLDWNSDFLNTYGEHLATITQGQADDSVLRKLLSPVYLLADLGRAVTRAPLVWVNQIESDVAAARGFNAAPPPPDRHLDRAGPTSQSSDAASERWAKARHGQAVANAFKNLQEAQRRDKINRNPGKRREEIRIIIGPDLDVDRGHLLGMEIAYALTAPTKFGLSWLIDGLGAPAWQNMSRRTLMAFDGQLGANPDKDEAQSEKGLSREGRANRAADFSTTGAIEVFREELLRIVADRGPDTRATTHPSGDYQVTLIGHSMGTIVLNEWLRRDLLEQRKQFYANIVYMAAACSIRDFSRSVIPYLVQHRADSASPDPARAAGTQFYNLMLHPLADLRERDRLFDLPPRGSLLVWLDNFLTDPQTPLDRTLGRWDNIVQATDLIPQAVRGQVTLKAFALAPYDEAVPPQGQPDYGPQAHGQFRGKPYWRPDFWKSESAVVGGN
ncbi:MAG TPA: hypothetical protein VIM11_23030 [Tepidisphaeraceae bacterium]|jgi:hypothetical protein